MCFLIKIRNRLHDVPGRLILNCSTPTEKNHRLKSIIRVERSYIKDTGDFLEKLKNVGNISSNAKCHISQY